MEPVLRRPRYASPEQLRGERVNTLSDVFSLGVILYESLTGAWPFGDPRSTADGVDRVLHGRGAGAPAQAVSEGAAAERRVTRDRLRRQIEGAGIVEARCGSKAAAEEHLRSALATQEKEMSRQPDLRVEICLRLMELLRASGREREAADAARQGLLAAAQAYGSYAAGHPFVVAMRRGLP